MKNKTSVSGIAAICVVVSLISGCATSQLSSGSVELPASRDIDLQHTVAPGDLLSGIAQQYTGAASRWEAIAAYNDIKDPRSLRIGDTIAIPRSLVPPTVESTASPKTASASQESLDVANSSKPRPDVTTTGALALQRINDVNVSSVGSKEVVVQPVTINLKPIAASTLGGTANDESSPPRVKVIGTYYPKGVYQQPASYSTLMMRVAPGTVFELEREINDWYKVVTDQGIGYLRMIDGRLIAKD
jgi:LysM repeat protein